jgi:hypothetical protein
MDLLMMPFTYVFLLIYLCPIVVIFCSSPLAMLLLLLSRMPLLRVQVERTMERAMERTMERMMERMMARLLVPRLRRVPRTLLLLRVTMERLVFLTRFPPSLFICSIRARLVDSHAIRTEVTIIFSFNDLTASTPYIVISNRFVQCAWFTWLAFMMLHVRTIYATLHSM